MNYDIIKNFYEEVKEKYGDSYKIVVDKNSNLDSSFIEKDSVNWELEDIIKDEVYKLKDNNTLSLEDKILSLYNFICLNYIYDDNVLYFFRMDDNNNYIAADFYGRIIDDNWINKRKKHNRRICYEFSRMFACAINMFIGDNKNMESFILGLKDNTHYITVISGDQYSAILDLDDFNKVKDLTRLKLGLTLEGITILRDDNNILSSAINKFNMNRCNELKEITKLSNDNLVDYLNKVIDIIKKYNLDSQGFQEYMRKKLEDNDIKVDKIWKKVTEAPEKRYARCLVFSYNSNKYLIDSINKDITIYNEDTLDKDLFVINPEDNPYSYFGG